MKKMYSTIVVAVIAVSFASIVCAAEPAQQEAPVMPASQQALSQKAPQPGHHMKYQKLRKVPKRSALIRTGGRSAASAPSR